MKTEEKNKGKEILPYTSYTGWEVDAKRERDLASALEVLASHGVEVMIARGDEYTPTPAVSHAILTYNRGRKTGLADGIVISRHTIRHMTAGSNTIPQTTHRHDYLNAYITYY